VRQAILAFCALVLAACEGAQPPVQQPSAAQASAIFQPWINGTDASEPQTQLQLFDADTYVIRQSLLTSDEAPFLYLLFGNDRALLLDTGAGNMQMRPAVDAAISKWLAAHGRASIPLVVAHSHGHGDHIAGDAEFAARPGTTVIGTKPRDVAAYFGISDWPKQIASFDLGGRKLDIIPTPGHQPAHIMIYDQRTGLLLSGDSLYPGRLYVPSNLFKDYRDSITRVAEFAQTRRISSILGAHIEMTTTPGKDFAMGAKTHPSEHLLELPGGRLTELKAALDGMGDAVTRDVRGDFIVFPAPVRPITENDLVP
jgi:glyoxylase-like metal-dependent hydrolase (beta-lactamase superfamily II)